MIKNILILILTLPILSFGQSFQNIKIDEDYSYKGPEEPAICISLKDTNIIMAAANIKSTYLSTDGGLNWKKKKARSRYGVFGDPCIISTNSGKFLYFHLSLPKGEPYVNESFLDRIVCQKTKRTPRKLNRGTFIGLNQPKDQDKEWAVYDHARNRVYITWTQFDQYGSKDLANKSHILASYSDDEGKNWSQPATLSLTSGNCIDDDETTEGAVPAIGLNGEMYVAWAYNNKIYFNSYIPDSNVTVEKTIANQPGGWNQEIDGLGRTNGLPITVSDMSDSPQRGHIYVCWSDQRNGELNTDIFITKSEDKGNTWTEPLKINNDTTETQQFLPWLTIDQTTGYLYCVFYDRRNYLNSQTDVYLAVSKDGGKTFENHKISDSPFTPESFVFFGDYINISAHNGTVRPIWTRYENGKLSVWTALIKGL